VAGRAHSHSRLAPHSEVPRRIRSCATLQPDSRFALGIERARPRRYCRYGPCVPGTFDESTPTDACTGRASAMVGRSSCTYYVQTDGLSAPVQHSCSALGKSTALHRTRAAAASVLSPSHLWHLAETLAWSPAAHPHTALLGCLGAERDGKGSLPGIGGCGYACISKRLLILPSNTRYEDGR
jgi:hypothetical protein